MQQNLGGAVPGIGTMANYGGMRYTNVVFAEDEDGLPQGWLPHATERHGYATGRQLDVARVRERRYQHQAAGRQERKRRKKTRCRACTGWPISCARPTWPALIGYEKGTPGILMIPQIVAQTMAGLGWTQRSIREFLWEHSKIPGDQIRRSGAAAWIEIDANPVTRESLKLDPWPISAKPGQFRADRRGGGHPTNSYWLQGYCPRVIGREVRVPESFDRLLADADRDLGCGSDACMI
jgi:hypothetical protein